MAGATRMGYEGILKYGTAGSSAATLVTNCVDLDYDTSVTRGNTTVRGAGTSPPIGTSRVTGIKPTITWKMLNKPADTTLAALIAAARTGAAVALRTISHDTGKGFDGDVTLEVKNGMPLDGEATYEFSAEATDDEGRAPLLNA